MHLQGIRIWHKLLILGLITLLLCAVPTILFVQSAYKDIRSGQLEIAGLAPTEALVRVIQPIQVHRGLAAAVLTGNQVLDNARVAKAKEVSEAIAQAQATVPAHATPVVEALRVVAEEWKFLAAALSDKNLPMEENYNRHSKVTGAALKALDSCIDHFGLSLDPDPESSFPIIEAYQNLPRLAESIARLRAIGVSILSIKQATAEERVSITALVERLREEMEQSNEMLKKAAGVNNARQKIEAAATAVMNDTQKLVNVTDLEFVRIEILRYDAADYLKLATTALDAQYNLIRLLHGEIQQTISDRTAEDTRTMWLLLMLVAALLAVGVAATYWIARSITRPLNAAVNDANAIAAGDLGNDIAAAGTDEVGQVRQSMRHMQHNLGQIVSHIRQSSDALGNAALEIAQSTQNMSARAEEQASSLEQTAASMEELNSSFHKNDESSRHVSDLAAQAAAAAEQGGVVVGKVTGTMQEIDTASKKISEIIGVIDGIAFQTNILALNAAVEAARAGEQGRGFAVVATEVRALAQRSADAAKEIRTLIGDSVKKVQAGTRESAESRKAMDGILAAVRKVASTMTEMHTVREDQRRGVSQVTVAIEQMNQGTQQTAAMVEEIAATADMLSQQAQELTRAVATFKLRQQQGSGAAAATQRDLSLPHASTNTGVRNDFGLTDDEIADEIAGNWRAGKQPLLPSAER